LYHVYSGSFEADDSGVFLSSYVLWDDEGVIYDQIPHKIFPVLRYDFASNVNILSSDQILNFFSFVQFIAMLPSTVVVVL
jgi:hypothetical protein